MLCLSLLQVNLLKKWLSSDDNRRGISQDKLFLVVNDIDTNAVAIKGGKIFSITYSLVGNVSKLNHLVPTSIWIFALNLQFCDIISI